MESWLESWFARENTDLKNINRQDKKFNTDGGSQVLTEAAKCYMMASVKVRKVTLLAAV